METEGPASLVPLIVTSTWTACQLEHLQPMIWCFCSWLAVITAAAELMSLKLPSWCASSC
jgi:hypothetical protein